MATQSVPGTVIPIGAAISPAGGFGAQGATGPAGPQGPLLLVGFASLTGAYTVTSGDVGKYFICTGGSWALTLPAPSVGFFIRVRNDQGITGTTGTITLTPTGGTIDGLSSLALLPGQECTILTDGTNWRTYERQRTVIVGTIDIASAVANQIILLPVGYRIFDIDILTSPATDGATMQMVFSTDGGSTFISTGYYDGIIFNNAAATTAYSYAGNAAYNRIGGSNQNIAARPSQYKLRIQPNLISGSQTVTWLSQSSGYSGTNAFLIEWLGGGALYQITSGIVNAMRLNYSSGNIANGSIIVRGIV